MRKRKKQTKLSRTTAHQKALLRNLSQELIRNGKITTTLTKAKALRPFVEPLITKAKTGGRLNEQILMANLYDREVVKNLVEQIGPRFAKENRLGGYTRIIKLGQRAGDSTEEAVIEIIS